MSELWRDKQTNRLPQASSHLVDPFAPRRSLSIFCLGLQAVLTLLTCVPLSGSGTWVREAKAAGAEQGREGSADLRVPDFNFVQSSHFVGLSVRTGDAWLAAAASVFGPTTAA